MLSKLSVYVFLILLSIKAISQNPLADSLARALKNHPQEDTVRVQILNALAFEKHFNFPSEGVVYALDARELSERLNYSQGKATSYRCTGLALWTQGSYESSLRAFLSGLKIADSCRFVQLQADLNGNIGLVYVGTKNYQLARQYFEASLQLQRQLKNRKREIVMLNNLGDCYRNLKQPEKALQFYMESRDLGLPIDYLLETNNRNIGNVYEDQGLYDHALQYYMDSKKLGDRFNAKRERCQVRLSIASVYKKKKAWAKATEYAKEALAIAEAGNLRALIRDCHQSLYEIAEQTANPILALKHLKLFDVYSDSVELLSKQSNLTALRLEYEIEKRQLEIETLKVNAGQKELELSLRNYLLFMTIASVVLLVGLLLFALYHYRFQKNRNKLLEDSVRQRTATLEEQNKALADYAHFNAHRLRAPLASIMGLVNLLTDPRQPRDFTTQSDMLTHLKISCDNLDSVIKEVNKKLHDGLSAYSESENQ
jgi:tetratricopeptide (TPR) repeat protein